MARVLVQSDADQSILLSEMVLPVHINSEHSAVQFLERLAWAIEDSEAPKRAHLADKRRGIDAARREARLLDS